MATDDLDDLYKPARTKPSRLKSSWLVPIVATLLLVVGAFGLLYLLNLWRGTQSQNVDETHQSQ